MSAHDEADRVGDAAHARLTAAVAGSQDVLERLARDLYDDPELGFEEHRSAQRIVALLRGAGYAVETGLWGLPTSFRATAGGGDGPHFAILAEYDALPGVGHACGHNIIAAIAVGAFLAAAPEVDRVGGRVSIIGTPAEENGGGKETIIRAGGFDDVDAAGMVHPSSGADLAVTGMRSTGVRRIAVTYHGRASHAAGAPWAGLNALDGAVSAYQGVAQLRQHILPTDRIHGIITDGGAVPNVVPERAAALFYVRAADVERLRELTDRVVAVLEGAATMTGTRAEIDIDPVPPYLPLRENRALAERWATSVAASGRPVAHDPGQGGPSTDMGNVTLYVPAIHPSIALGTPADVGPHTADFAEWTVREASFAAMRDAAVALAATAVDYLTDADLRQQVAAEFAAAGGRERMADG